MKRRYIILSRSKYSSGNRYEVEFFESASAMAEAIKTGEFADKDFLVAHRMEIEIAFKFEPLNSIGDPAAEAERALPVM